MPNGRPPEMASRYVPTGVDVGAGGTVYFTASRNDAICRVQAARRAHKLASTPRKRQRGGLNS